MGRRSRNLGPDPFADLLRVAGGYAHSQPGCRIWAASRLWGSSCRAWRLEERIDGAALCALSVKHLQPYADQLVFPMNRAGRLKLL
jgi:hypothetical protein